MLSSMVLLGLMACFWAIQFFLGDLDRRLVQYERYELAQGFNLPLLKLVEPAKLKTDSELALHQLLGKNVLLHFWASWCAACREERPLLQELVNQHHDGSLAVIGIASYDSEAALRSSGLLAEVPFTVLLDDDGDVAMSYKVRALPQSVLIDAEGRVRYRIKGQLTLSELAAIEAILITIEREKKASASP
ncbi:MAG: TlpA disulfide reductase family protein, partial [Proteobacteria bacterium]|nr:TlpA disulfide reductase family protein [Pseudomonadota bacterium]